MQMLLLLYFLIGCSSFVELDERNVEDTHNSQKISYHQLGLKFKGNEKKLSDQNEAQLNQLAQRIIQTSQPIKEITIFSNPDKKKLTPKKELINYDRAQNTKRFLEKDLHTHAEIQVKEKKSSPHQYKKDADILILIEYM